MKDAKKTPLNQRRKKVIGRLLTRATRAYQERAVDETKSRGFEDYRLGDNAVLIHLEVKGNRISELAKRSGLTKQAISQLVSEMENRGLVEKQKDPTDGRAFLVKYTDHGFALLEAGVDVVEEIDEWILDILGERRTNALRKALGEIAEELDPDGF